MNVLCMLGEFNYPSVKKTKNWVVLIDFLGNNEKSHLFFYLVTDGGIANL